jgi:hypothetical protein
LAFVPMAEMATSQGISSMAPSMGTGRRRPEASGSPSFMRWTLDAAHTDPSSPARSSSGSHQLADLDALGLGVVHLGATGGHLGLGAAVRR